MAILGGRPIQGARRGFDREGRPGPARPIDQTVPIDSPGPAGRGRPFDDGDGKKRIELPRNRARELTAEEEASIRDRIASLRRKSAEALGVPSDDLDVLEGYLDGDLRAYIGWKLSIGESLPDRLRDFAASTETPPLKGGDPSEEALSPADRRTERSAADAEDTDMPAALRREWRRPLAEGSVERVGLGIIDEREREFSTAERAVAEFLAWEHSAVVASPEDHSRYKIPQFDAYVDRVPTEFKSLEPGAGNAAVKGAIKGAIGQARCLIVDGRAAALSEEDADRGLQRFLGTPQRRHFDSIRIIGDGFDIRYPRRPDANG